MKAPTKLRTLYIDFDAFFANVEKQLKTEDRHRPVGISAFPSDHSAIIAQCYVAKAFGLHRGIKVNEAKRLCPNIRIVSARHDVYVQMHHRIIASIEKHATVKKVWSVDEMECDFGSLSDSEIIRIAHNIREQLREDIGEYITPSMGLSSNNLLAKIAAEMNKPNAFEVLHPLDLPGALLNVSLRDVPGIASNMEQRLKTAGVKSMKELFNSNPKQLRAIWRSVEGERLWLLLHGYPIEKTPTKRAMFGHSRQLSGEWTSLKRAADCLHLLTCQAARRMRKSEFLATKLTITFKDQNKVKWSEEETFAPIRDDHNILRHMQSLYKLGTEKSAATHIRQVYIMLHGLVKKAEATSSIFMDYYDLDQCQKLSHLSDTIDQTNKKYKMNVLTVGLHEQPPGDYAGGKIAFGRIPDSMAYLKRIQVEGESPNP